MSTAPDIAIDRTRPVNCWIHKLYADADDPGCLPRVIQLIVYPDVHQMRAAGTRYSRRRHTPEDLSDALGLFQPSLFRSRYDRRKHTWIDTTAPFAGVMRLARDWLHGDIIAHESAHAALHIWRLYQWGKPGSPGRVELGDNNSPAEEAFCHLLGGIAGEVANVVWKIEQKEDA